MLAWPACYGLVGVLFHLFRVHGGRVSLRGLGALVDVQGEAPGSASPDRQCNN